MHIKRGGIKGTEPSFLPNNIHPGVSLLNYGFECSEPLKEPEFYFKTHIDVQPNNIVISSSINEVKTHAFKGI